MLSFFFSTAAYNYFNQSPDFVKWGSPDETANYVFTKIYAQTGDLRIFEKYNLIAADIVHPRSFRSDFGYMKPVSFLGIILIYGKLAKWFGIAIIPFITPFIGALGILGFYLLIKEVFGRRYALVSAGILTFFPIYSYYSARSMFHNIPFTVLAIFSFYFLTLGIKSEKVKNKFLDFKFSGFGKFLKRDLLWPLLAGLFFGGAVMVRSSELIWLLPVIFIIWIGAIRKISLQQIIIFLAALMLALTPMLYWNKILYGSFISGGYNEMNASLSALSQAGGEIVASRPASWSNIIPQKFEEIKNIIFYFGFHPRQSLIVFKHYVWEMFPWLTLTAAAGLFIIVGRFKKWTKRRWAFIAAWTVASIILVFYYGSWKFIDNPDPNRFTIGNSYTRYWLPLYLGAIALTSVAIVKASDWIFFYVHHYRKYLRRRVLSNSIIIVILFLLAVKNFNFTWFGSEEGLAYTLFNNLSSRVETQAVWAATESNAVIITRYHDKWLFPERKVIVGLLTDNNMNFYYSRLAAKLPVYYYNFKFSDKDLAHLNASRLADLNLEIVFVKRISREFSLYKLIIKK